MTKEQVLAKAKELGVSLTEEQISEHVANDTLPEKKESNYSQRKEELKSLSVDQLIEKIFEVSGEARDRRLEVKELKASNAELQRQLGELTEKAKKFPELEGELNKSKSSLQKLRDAEVARRKNILTKVDEAKREKLGYLLEEVITADQFDSTVEMFIAPKSSGMEVPNPSDPPAVNLTEEQKAEAARMGLDPQDYAEVMSKRKK